MIQSYGRCIYICAMHVSSEESVRTYVRNTVMFITRNVLYVGSLVQVLNGMAPVGSVNLR